MVKVVLYALKTCATSEKARKWLVDHQIPFEERFLEDRLDWQDEAIALTDQFTAPVLLYPDGRVEVGFGGETG